MSTYLLELIDIPAFRCGYEKFLRVFLSFHGPNGDEIVTFVGCNGVDSRYRYCRVIKFSDVVR